MADDYKAEILPRLNESLIYTRLKMLCQDKDSDVIASTDAAVAYSYQRSKSIMRHMGEYTLHDGDHLFRVLYLMELLLTKENVMRLHAPELFLLILSAFFHDIGMAPSEKEVEIWQQAWNETEINPPEEDKTTFEEFRRYIMTKPDELETIQRIQKEGDHVLVNTLKGYLITEYIRKTHAQRSRAILDKDPILNNIFNNRIVFRKKDLTVELANICYSHNEDAIGLLDLDKNLVCSQDIYACLPLIGVILRLADIIDFDAKRTPEVLFSHLNIKHPVSLVEWQKHRSIEAWDIHPESIQFSAKCSHPAIEAAIRKFCDYIDDELSVCNNILNTVGEFPKFNSRKIIVRLPLRVNRDKIEAEKDVYDKPAYLYRDTRFTLSKQQVIDLLMGTKLYGNPEVALRELLQNSLDACLLRQVMENKWDNKYSPEIQVKLYESDGQQILEVSDNGIGMDQEVVDKFYTKVGASFYKSSEFNNLMVDSNTDIKFTSRFGIGILSVFMVADGLEVDTMKIYGPEKSSDALNLTVEGQDSIFWIKPGQRNKVGTTTKLRLRKGKNPWDKIKDDAFIKSVITTIPNPPFSIRIQAGTLTEIRDQSSFLSSRPKLSPKGSWANIENVKSIEFGFEGNGISGSCLVAILENRKKPTIEFQISEKVVQVEGEEFPLSKYFRMEDNQISIKSTAIGIDKDGKIKTENTYNDRIRSDSSISLHGIEIPSDLFPESWSTRKGQVNFEWPFPINLVVDVKSPMDLDLNSARSEILKGDKVDTFEEELAYCIGCGIKAKVSKNYWDAFHKKIIASSASSIFRKGMERANQQKGNSPKIFDLPEPPLEIEVQDNLPF